MQSRLGRVRSFVLCLASDLILYESKLSFSEISSGVPIWQSSLAFTFTSAFFLTQEFWVLLRTVTGMLLIHVIR